jgi:hypothetical protein
MGTVTIYCIRFFPVLSSFSWHDRRAHFGRLG